MKDILARLANSSSNESSHELQCRCFDAAEEISRLRSLLDAVQVPVRNAMRYRWLRERDVNAIDTGGLFVGMTPNNIVLNGDDLDIAIDAAMTPNVKLRG
jgi:hypothetical protein